MLPAGEKRNIPAGQDKQNTAGSGISCDEKQGKQHLGGCEVNQKTGFSKMENRLDDIKANRLITREQKRKRRGNQKSQVFFIFPPNLLLYNSK